MKIEDKFIKAINENGGDYVTHHGAVLVAHYCVEIAEQECINFAEWILKDTTYEFKKEQLRLLINIYYLKKNT